MNTTKYVEVNAQKFLCTFITLLENKRYMEDIMNDEHYIFRISDIGIELGYPEDAPLVGDSSINAVVKSH